MTFTELKTDDEVMEECLKNPEFKKEWERTALARAVATEVIKYRAEKSISQAELAKCLGMHQPAVAKLEDGDHNPSFAILRRLSEKLGIELGIHIRPGEIDVERLDKLTAS